MPIYKSQVRDLDENLRRGILFYNEDIEDIKGSYLTGDIVQFEIGGATRLYRTKVDAPQNNPANTAEWERAIEEASGGTEMPSSIVLVPASGNAALDALAVAGYSSAKWFIQIEGETSGNRASEIVTAVIKKNGTAAVSEFALLGDDILYGIAVLIVESNIILRGINNESGESLTFSTVRITAIAPA